MAKKKSRSSTTTPAAPGLTESPRSVDPTARPMWLDNIRVFFRNDVPVSVLVCETVYPDMGAVQEIARMYTSVEHMRKIVQVLAAQLDAYDKDRASKGKARTVQVRSK